MRLCGSNIDKKAIGRCTHVVTALTSCLENTLPSLAYLEVCSPDRLLKSRLLNTLGVYCRCSRPLVLTIDEVHLPDPNASLAFKKLCSTRKLYRSIKLCL